MKIILANIDGIFNNPNIDEFMKFAQKEINNSQKKIQHSIGRYILDYGLKNFYKIDSYKININKNGKPFIDNGINFSISHSKNFVAVAFSDSDIGIDIEFMKFRNYKLILNHYGINSEINKPEFFQLWTDYEARIKSGLEGKSLSFKIGNYICSVSSNKTQLEMYEAIIPTAKSNPNELISLKLAKASNKNENAVDNDDANTAVFEFLSPLDLKIE